MLYILICKDKPNAQELRQSVRQDHLQFLATRDVRFAGPMLSDDESQMIGSVVVVDCPTMADAQALAAADPYKQADLFAEVTIHPFKQAIPGV